jgi:VanZ family protein
VFPPTFALVHHYKLDSFHPETKLCYLIQKMKKFLRFIPAIIWMCVIFYFSSRQTTGIASNNYCLRFFMFKSFHLIEYATLFVFINFALESHIYSIIISYFYGVSDEIHQSFTPGRTPKFTDTLIDLLGILIGFLVFKYILIPLFKKYYHPKT